MDGNQPCAPPPETFQYPLDINSGQSGNTTSENAKKVQEIVNRIRESQKQEDK